MVNLDDLKAQIKNLSPTELAARGVIEPARKSANGEKTFICPNCGNGSGKSGDGIAFKYKGGAWLAKCFKCGEGYDNLKLLALHYGIANNGAGHIEILKRAAADFGIATDLDFQPKKFSAYHNLQPMQLNPAAPVNPVKPRAQDSKTVEVEKLTNDYIKQVLALPDNLENLPLDCRRGLSIDTLRHFHCVYVEKWLHPKIFVEHKLGLRSKLPPRSRRLLIPTQDGLHYNAVILAADKAATPKNLRKMHAGKISSLFGIETIEAATEIIFTYEGEINAMTEWQEYLAQYQELEFVRKTIDIFGGVEEVFKISDNSVEGEKVSRGALARKAFIATCSASNKSWIEQIDAKCRELNIRPIFVIRYDNDDAGKIGAEYAKTELQKRGYLVKISLYDGGNNDE